MRRCPIPSSVVCPTLAARADCTGDILNPMRVVALALALVIAAISSVDPLCCADGCTRTDLAATTHSAPRGGECPICQPGAVAITPELPVACFELAATALPLAQTPLDSIARAIEHPPRS